MSHVSISRSYAVLVGLEAYVKSRRRGKKLVQKLIHGRDKLLSPEEVAKREEEERDKSESAAMEQKFLEMQEQEERERSANIRLLNKLRIRSRTGPEGGESKLEGPTGVKKEIERAVDLDAPGTGPEDAIPPEGTRTESLRPASTNRFAPDSTKDV